MKPDPKQIDIFFEFRESSLHVLAEDQGWDGPIERDEQGHLTPSSIQSLAQTLGGFLHRHTWSAPRQVLCSIPARGVSIRTLGIPISGADETEHMLALQMESQLPVPPEELAWGFLPLTTTSESDTLKPFLVAAVKKEVLAPYATLFRELQLEPTFTIAAFTRLAACPAPPAPCHLLDVGQTRSELITRDAAGATTLRVIAWGGAELLEVSPLIQTLQAQPSPNKLLLTGLEAPLAQLATQLAPILNRPVVPLDLESGPGRTAANLGAKTQLARASGELLRLQTPSAEKPERVSRAEWKWAVAAVLLLFLVLAATYLHPVLQKPRLERQLAELKSYRASLPHIERELSFLEFIKTNQPPYLDTIYLLADSSPRGLKLQSLSIGRRGDLSLRGKASDPDGANQFRAKLVDSGFFSQVVVEEQTPDQNRREVTFRISAEIKPEGQRQPLPAPSATKTKPPARPSPENRAGPTLPPPPKS